MCFPWEAKKRRFESKKGQTGFLGFALFDVMGNHFQVNEEGTEKKGRTLLEYTFVMMRTAHTVNNYSRIHLVH